MEYYKYEDSHHRQNNVNEAERWIPASTNEPANSSQAALPPNSDNQRTSHEDWD